MDFRNCLKYEIHVRFHTEVTGAPEGSAVRTVCVSWTDGDFPSASYSVCAALSLSNTSLLDDTHSPLHRIISCCMHSWSLSEPHTAPVGHHYLNDVMICAFHKEVLCPSTLGTYSSLPCENVLTNLLSWSEL